MRALILNFTLTARPEQSNTEALVDVVAAAMRQEEIDVDVVHVADQDATPGVSDDRRDDEWSAVLALLRNAEILVIATPTWRSQPSSIAERVLERMDALVAETDEQGRPFAYNRVGGIVVTGHEDGAHHVIAEVARSLIDIGYTVPGQAWTYWNMGPRPGPSYLGTDHEHDWSERTGRTAAANLVAVARALAEGPMPAPAE
jgi:multimeric flavodoxin WrbA